MADANLPAIGNLCAYVKTDMGVYNHPGALPRVPLKNSFRKLTKRFFTCLQCTGRPVCNKQAYLCVYARRQAQTGQNAHLNQLSSAFGALNRKKIIGNIPKDSEVRQAP